MITIKWSLAIIIFFLVIVAWIITKANKEAKAMGCNKK